MAEAPPPVLPFFFFSSLFSCPILFFFDLKGLWSLFPTFLNAFHRAVCRTPFFPRVPFSDSLEEAVFFFSGRVFFFVLSFFPPFSRFDKNDRFQKLPFLVTSRSLLLSSVVFVFSESFFPFFFFLVDGMGHPFFFHFFFFRIKSRPPPPPMSQNDQCPFLALLPPPVVQKATSPLQMALSVGKKSGPTIMAYVSFSPFLFPLFGSSTPMASERFSQE